MRLRIVGLSGLSGRQKAALVPLAAAVLLLGVVLLTVGVALLAGLVVAGAVAGVGLAVARRLGWRGGRLPRRAPDERIVLDPRQRVEADDRAPLDPSRRIEP
jgi:hypothetical protein